MNNRELMNSNLHPDHNQPIAIIGLAGRFPGARTVAEYWKNLCNGVESISIASDEELLAKGVNATLLKNPDFVKASGVVEDAELFDASFFGIGAREAEILDPQQRIFLECAWEALEDAGCNSQTYQGAIGVFAGAGMNTYGTFNLISNPEVIGNVGAYQVMLGNDKDFLATRVAYKLNLKGPAISVQTACSTSLVAVQMAFESLRRGECDMALAGGVSIFFPQNGGYLYIPGMILSPDGHCRAFDADAAGTVPGRGAGIVALKRLNDAVRDGDRIYAVIRGAAINNDGAAKVGYSAPSIEGQSRVIRKSMEMAGISPESIRYIEAHGTGTEVGDPIEIAALTEAFGNCAGERQFCAIGSVKTNIGHLDTAAGVAGLIKAALSLHHRKMPPTLHFKKPNPHIDFAQTPFYVNASLRPYEDTEPFRAGVSSFGIGGTNAHVTLEEWRQPASTNDEAPQLIVLSARSESALDAQTEALSVYLEQSSASNLAQIAFTLQAGRKTFSHRRAFVARHLDDLKQSLQQRKPSRLRDSIATQENGPVAFLFPGQGSQYVNMGRGLYETNQTFRSIIDHCTDILHPHLGLDLRGVLYPESSNEEAQTLLNQTWITQPALFAVEYATACAWRELGVEPAAMIGHSVGEYVAACLAGVFTLEDALSLIAARGRLIQTLPAGAMLALPLSEADVQALLPSDLSIAAVNSPRNTVVSGTIHAIEVFEANLHAMKIASRRLRTSHAFHSAMMEPALDAFEERVRSITLHPPSIPFVSNVTGKWITEEEATNPAYWTRHLRQPVRFADCIATIEAQSPAAVLETGPGDTLLSMVRDTCGKNVSFASIASMRNATAQSNDQEHWLDAVGRLWLAGVSPRWEKLHNGNPPQKTTLPTYLFERRRFWIERNNSVENNAVQTDIAQSKNPDISSWFYAPSWKRSTLAAHPPKRKSDNGKICLLLTADAETSAGLSRTVEDISQVITVQAAVGFKRVSEDRFEINLVDKTHYALLMEQLIADGLWPERVIHTLSLGSRFHETLDTSLENGFLSVMYLLQAIGDISSTRSVTFYLLTASGCDVLGNGTCNPKAAMLSGIGKVIPLESPNINCRVIDLENSHLSASVTRQLVSELSAEEDAKLVAFRSQGRWLPCYEHVSVAGNLPHAIHIPEKATFLITGGLGGVGLVWAQYLSKQWKARIVLTSRSPFPAQETWTDMLSSSATSEALKRRMRNVERIRKLGGEVRIATADTTDIAAMQELFASACAEFGSVHGIIHAAGIPGIGMLHAKSREDALSVLSPKMHGMEWITGLLHKDQLRMVMLCSSISAIVPGVGLADYASANAYLDAYALAHDNPAGTRVLSTNWDTWSDTGMAFDLAQGLAPEDIRAEVLSHGITTAEAEQVFSRLLSHPMPQWVVSTRDLNKLIDAAYTSPLNAARALKNSIGASHERPTLNADYVAPVDDTELAIVAIWQELLGVDPIGTQDNFFELGGHSLLGTQMMARIRERFGIDLPLRSIFEASTPAAMAHLLRAIPWASGQGSALGIDMEREEIEL